MKKLLLALVLLLTITLSGCEKIFEIEEDTDWLCEFTYYGETHNFATGYFEGYTYSKASTWIKLEKIDGDIILMDLTQVSVLCTEIENVESE